MKKIIAILLMTSCSKTTPFTSSSYPEQKIATYSNPVTPSSSDTIKIQASVRNVPNTTICSLTAYLSKQIPDTITVVARWVALNYSFTDTIKIAGTREHSISTRSMYYHDVSQVSILSAKVNNSKYILKY